MAVALGKKDYHKAAYWYRCTEAVGTNSRGLPSGALRRFARGSSLAEEVELPVWTPCLRQRS
jgi:hypothetical protein